MRLTVPSRARLSPSSENRLSLLLLFRPQSYWARHDLFLELTLTPLCESRTCSQRDGPPQTVAVRLLRLQISQRQDSNQHSHEMRYIRLLLPKAQSDESLWKHCHSREARR